SHARSQSSVSGYATFIFHHPPTTEIYTLSLHDALPISGAEVAAIDVAVPFVENYSQAAADDDRFAMELMLRHGIPADVVHAKRRSEEHTSELQSLAYLVCRLLLEKKKICQTPNHFCAKY